MKTTIKDIPTHLLKTQLKAIKMVIGDYADARWDASKAAVAFQEIVDELRLRGDYKGIIRNPIYSVDYWQGENIKNENLNKNPITRIDEYYNVIRSRPNKSIDERRQKMIKLIDEAIRKPIINPTPNSPEGSKFQLRVAWTGDFKDESKILQFFEEMDLGTPTIETYNTGERVNHLLLYIFEGSSEGFKILKRSVNVMLNIFCGEDFEIGISGKKLT